MSATQEVIKKNDGGIAVYNEFRSQLAELKNTNAKMVFDYETAKGVREARSYIYKLRQTKAAVDKARVHEKAVSLEYGRRVDAEAKEIIAEIETMMEVHEAPLLEIERREKVRVEGLNNRLNEMIETGRYTSEQWMALPVEAMKDRLAEIEAERITQAGGVPTIAWQLIEHPAREKYDLSRSESVV